MTPTQVLAHLQGMFPDRLVLYAEDLAQVLGKSRKAVTHLLSQYHLPFKVPDGHPNSPAYGHLKLPHLN